MKLKDKINLIREELENEIKPLDNKSILTNAQITPRTELPKKNYFLIFRPALAILLLLIIVIPLTISFLNSSQDGFNSIDDENNDIEDGGNQVPVDPNVETDFVTLSEYGFVAASIINLVDANNNAASTGQYQPSNGLLVVSHLNKINQLLPQIEMLFNSNNHTFKKEISDNSNYKYKLKYTGKNIYNKEITYDIFLNENIKSESLIELELQITANNNTYNLVGSVELSDKVENIEMTYYPDYTNNSDYLLLTKQSVDNNSEYIVKLVNNNSIINHSKLSIKQDKKTYILLEQVHNTSDLLFNIYKDDHDNYSINYLINLGDGEISEGENNYPEIPEDQENDENPNEFNPLEKGTIEIDISKDENTFIITAKNKVSSFKYANTPLFP